MNKFDTLIVKLVEQNEIRQDCKEFEMVDEIQLQRVDLMPIERDFEIETKNKETNYRDPKFEHQHLLDQMKGMCNLNIIENIFQYHQ